MKLLLVALALPTLLAALSACGSTGDVERPHANPWHPIEWRGFGRSDLPAGWKTEGDLITYTPGIGGGDIVSVREYDDFELELEWRISPGGNSGIFYRVEEEGHDTPWRTGPEMQILDNAGHPDGGDPRTSAGSNYALHAPERDVSESPGKWNRARILVRRGRVEHWLNGVRLLAYDLWTPDWEARVAASKFASMPDYGRKRVGHIALQDHGDPVAFRNVRIRDL